MTQATGPQPLSLFHGREGREIPPWPEQGPQHRDVFDL